MWSTSRDSIKKKSYNLLSVHNTKKFLQYAWKSRLNQFTSAKRKFLNTINLCKNYTLRPLSHGLKIDRRKWKVFGEHRKCSTNMESVRRRWKVFDAHGKCSTDTFFMLCLVEWHDLLLVLVLLYAVICRMPLRDVIKIFFHEIFLWNVP